MQERIDILEIRERIPEEVFDYQTLSHALKEYERPRNRITALLQSGDIIRVKKGLYIFGVRLRRRPVSRELLSNLIFGPSYISREYALSYHGLIPEEVTIVSAMTTGRSQKFQTPVGTFTYSRLSLQEYPIGVTLGEYNERNFLIAAPEKALADYIIMQRGMTLRSDKDVERLLFDDLRIDPDGLSRFSPALLKTISARTASKRVQFAMKAITKSLMGNRYE